MLHSFQNEEVIDKVTLPNVVYNLSKTVNSGITAGIEDEVATVSIDSDSVSLDTLSKVSFYCGDWGSLPSKLLNSEETLNKFESSQSEKFDLILSCETIYNTINYDKLIGTFKSCLKSDGVMYPL